MLLVWLGVFAALILFCWELTWKLEEVQPIVSAAA